MVHNTVVLHTDNWTYVQFLPSGIEVCTGLGIVGIPRSHPRGISMTLSPTPWDSHIIRMQTHGNPPVTVGFPRVCIHIVRESHGVGFKVALIPRNGTLEFQKPQTRAGLYTRVMLILRGWDRSPAGVSWSWRWITWSRCSRTHTLLSLDTFLTRVPLLQSANKRSLYYYY